MVIVVVWEDRAEDVFEARNWRIGVRNARRARDVLVKVLGNSSINMSFFVLSSDGGGGCFDGCGCGSVSSLEKIRLPNVPLRPRKSSNWADIER